MQRSSHTITRPRALQQFARLGYTIIDGSSEEQGPCVVTGRSSAGEVVLLPRLHNALRFLNPDVTSQLLEQAVSELTSNLSLYSLAEANERVYSMLIDGIKLDARGQLVTNDAVDKTEKDTYKTLRIIEWEKADNNDFTLVSRLWVNGKLGKRCLDLVCFVNGLPFVLLEIMDSELPTIFTKIDQDYKKTLPALFWYNAFIVVADTFTCKMGSLTDPIEGFIQWKRIKDEREIESTRLDTLIEGTCDKERLLDIIENFTLFDRSKQLRRLVARNHQYLGVNNAVASLRGWEEERQARRLRGEPEAQKQHGKLGVFWHTQGSGKSYSMVFFVRKVQRTVSNDYTFVVVTDRQDLDTQIYNNFQHSGSISEAAEEVQAKSADHLKLLLSGTHLLLFTLIQKFRGEAPGQDYTEVSNNEKIIVIADEAHRTQYDTLARNMRIAMPRAAFIGFTGTPLMDGEEQTRETFGDYVSIYNFRRAINDGITVPLVYENRTPYLDLVNQQFQEEMAELLEEAMLDERQEQKVFELYARPGNFFIKAERLDSIATDIVGHFMTRGYMGKAMVVALDKITAVRMYNRVQEQWGRYKEELRRQMEQESDPDKKVELINKIAYMDETRMAVVVSASEGDSERFAKFSRELGEEIEIAPHHERFKYGKLAEAFKAAEDPLRIVFVCAMWMTGFDVPCLSTIYLDRPLKGHTLMQTIARANRVYEDKVIGTIIDYASTMGALAKAMAIYAKEDSGGESEGDRPVDDKSELVQKLRSKLGETTQFCTERGINVQALLSKLPGEGDKQRQGKLVEGAVDALVISDEVKLYSLLLTTEVSKLYKAILPDTTEQEFTWAVHLYKLIKDGIYETMRATGVSDILGRTRKIVHESLEVKPTETRLSADTLKPRGSFDLRDIDLEALDRDLHRGYRHKKAEEMRHLLYERLRRMIDVNPSRVKYMEKLERAIRSYNDGCANVAIDPPLVNPQEKITQHPASGVAQVQEAYIKDLVEITGEIAEEEQRPEQEGVSEEVLAIFDLLASHRELSEEQCSVVKAIAQKIMVVLRPKLNVLDWHNKPPTRSQVKTAIGDELLKLPEVYSQEQRKQKRDELFLYVWEHYKDGGKTSVA